MLLGINGKCPETMEIYKEQIYILYRWHLKAPHRIQNLMQRDTWLPFFDQLYTILTYYKA